MEQSPPVIIFSGVSFTYPGDATRSPPDVPVFTNLDTSVPAGIISLVGQNGTGKSTFLLLAGGRLRPDTGSVSILGRDSRSFADEEERNRWVGFVYQNMEFETREATGPLLEGVYADGLHRGTDRSFFADVVRSFELAPCLSRPLQSLSKGEIQRTVMAFALLYGSRVLMMDEPVFALEKRQKERALEFIADYGRRTGRSILLSLHELDLSRRYTDSAILFFRDGSVRTGNTAETLSRENLEAAYESPFGLLYRDEDTFRERLVEEHRLLSAYHVPEPGKN